MININIRNFQKKDDRDRNEEYVRVFERKNRRNENNTLLTLESIFENDDKYY